MSGGFLVPNFPGSVLSNETILCSPVATYGTPGSSPSPGLAGIVGAAVGGTVGGLLAIATLALLALRVRRNSLVDRLGGHPVSPRTSIDVKPAGGDAVAARGAEEADGQPSSSVSREPQEVQPLGVKRSAGLPGDSSREKSHMERNQVVEGSQSAGGALRRLDRSPSGSQASGSLLAGGADEWQCDRHLMGPHDIYLWCGKEGSGRARAAPKGEARCLPASFC